jgi:PAS domain S-box-containing protein
MKKSLQRERLSSKITIIYVIVGALWIFLSDKIMAMFYRTPEDLTHISIIKGWMFILVTALLLYNLISRGIKEMDKSQEALHLSEQRFGDMFELASVGMAQADPYTGRWQRVNERLCAITGYSAEELMGMSFPEITHPEDRKYDWEAFQRVVQGKTPEYRKESRYVRKDGTIVWVNVNAALLQDTAGRPLSCLALIEDITERRRTEEELRLNESRLESLLKISQHRSESIQTVLDYALDEAIVLTKSEVGYIYSYDEVTRQFTLNTWSREVMQEGAIAEPQATYQLDQTGIWGEAVRQARPIMVNDFEAPHPGQKGGHVELRKYLTIPIFSDQRIVAVVGVANKATDYDEADVRQLTLMMDAVWKIVEQKKFEEERLKLAKLESLGILAGGIAHDFNNILTAIIGNISLAKLDRKMQDQGRERLTEAEEACQQAQILARQLLTFARGGSPIKELASLEKLVTESASLACRGSQVRCEFSFPEDLKGIEGDPGQIRQVMQNLIINAIQAMPDGGCVKIWGENLAIGEPGILPLDMGNYVRVSIQDQGIGIPAEYLQKIFDPYYTTKQKGSGLGLTAAYSIISNHRGHISVESTLGKGTTFHVYLPASDQKIIQQHKEDLDLLFGKGKILVMDDEAMVRQVLGRMLQTLGYEVEFAGDGVEAIEIFTEAQKSGDVFAGAILDLTVPGGMGGKEVMARLLKIDPQVKAIVSSGYSDDPIMADFQAFGFTGVIAKPYRISELSKVLNQVLTGDRGRP